MYVGELTEKGYIRFIFQRFRPSVRVIDQYYGQTSQLRLDMKVLRFDSFLKAKFE